MIKPSLVITSCGSEEKAREIARDLVDRQLAASVTLIPVQTYFRFGDQSLNEEEIQLLVLTTADRYAEVEARILALHTYEVPDVLMLQVDAISAPTMTWLASSTTNSKGESL